MAPRILVDDPVLAPAGLDMYLRHTFNSVCTRCARTIDNTEVIMIALKKVLVATDFGPASESALRYGQALARAFGAELHVLHVVENIVTRAMDGYGYAAIAPEVQQDVERAGCKQTEALVSDEDRRELHAVAATVTSNSPADAIVDYACHAGVELIVMGTHGRRGIRHAVLGSDAEAVLHGAEVPVLLVPVRQKS
jgi:nucleotide-binding universal stress UspA family protein